MQPAPRKRFLIEILLFLSYFVFGLSWIGYSPFLHDIQAQYQLSHATAGLVISSVSFAKIFMPFIAGYLALRWGVSRTLALGMACICASLLTPFAPGFIALLASRVVFGLGGAVVVTLIGSAVLEWFPKNELPLVNGFNYVAVNTGITTALFVTPPLAQAFGRTNTLFAYALASLVIAIAWFAFGRDRAPARQPGSARGVSTARYLDIIRMKEAWLLTFAAAGPLCVYLVFNTWLPTYYVQRFQLDAAQAARLTGLSNMVGIPAAIFGGLITRKLPARKPLIVFSGLLVGIASFGLFLTANLLLLKICAVLFGVGLFLWISPLMTLGMELPGMTPERLALLNGVCYGVGYMAAFLAPVVAGALRDRTGSFIPGLILAAVLSWSLAIGGILLPETSAKKN
ncbi:MAG: MFS transporter [Oligoflexia bacterium]|nr:MFS transporter [Oligoflexia bacterium]